MLNWCQLSIFGTRRPHCLRNLAQDTVLHTMKSSAGEHMPIIHSLADVLLSGVPKESIAAFDMPMLGI